MLLFKRNPLPSNFWKLLKIVASFPCVSRPSAISDLNSTPPNFVSDFITKNRDKMTKLNLITYTFLFLLPLALCTSSHLAPASSVAPPRVRAYLIEQTCESASEKDFCNFALKSDANSEGSDLPGLVSIALSLTAANGSDTSIFIKNLLNDMTLDPAVQQYLSNCYDQYTDAVQQVEDSMAAMTAEVYDDVFTWLKVAVSDVETCEQQFGTESPDKRILADRSGTFLRLCNMALDIAKLLKKK